MAFKIFSLTRSPKKYDLSLEQAYLYSNFTIICYLFEFKWFFSIWIHSIHPINIKCDISIMANSLNFGNYLLHNVPNFFSDLNDY